MSLEATVSTKVTWKNEVKQETYPTVLEDQKPLVCLVHSVDLVGAAWAKGLLAGNWQ